MTAPTSTTTTTKLAEAPRPETTQAVQPSPTPQLTLQTCRRHPEAGRFMRTCSGCARALFDTITANEAAAMAPAPTVDRRTRHAVDAALATSPARRAAIIAHAERYLAQTDRLTLPAGCSEPIANDLRNRLDAYRMHGGAALIRYLGLSITPDDPALPGILRAVYTTATGLRGIGWLFLAAMLVHAAENAYWDHAEDCEDCFCAATGETWWCTLGLDLWHAWMDAFGVSAADRFRAWRGNGT